ncbi:MAG: hypothetical protein ACR652_18655 [Methylocystis sp.]|uniref:hypothetical protein n=1 Tax=Methylocystis sp. TaxID=1911079 RepID=UPI003DA58F40
MITKELIEDAKTAGFEPHPVHGGLIVRHSNGSWINIEKGLTVLAELQRQRERQAVPTKPDNVLSSFWDKAMQGYRFVIDNGFTAPSMEGMHYEHVHVDPSDESDAGKVSVLVPDGFTIVPTDQPSRVHINRIAIGLAETFGYSWAELSESARARIFEQAQAAFNITP